MARIEFKTVKFKGNLGKKVITTDVKVYGYIKGVKLPVVQFSDSNLKVKIMLKVMKNEVLTDASTCEWLWITLKASFDNINDAIDFIGKNEKAILERYELKLNN